MRIVVTILILAFCSWALAVQGSASTRRVLERLDRKEDIVSVTLHWGYRDEGDICQVFELTLTMGEYDDDETMVEFAARTALAERTFKATDPYQPDETCPQNPPMQQPPP